MGFPRFPKTQGTLATPRKVYLLFSPVLGWSGTPGKCRMRYLSRWFPKMIVTDPVDPDMVCRDPQAIDRMSRDALVWRQGHGIFLSRGKIVNHRFNWKLHQRSKDLGIVLESTYLRFEESCTPKRSASRLPCACAGRDLAGTMQAKHCREAEWSLTSTKEKYGKG